MRSRQRYPVQVMALLWLVSAGSAHGQPQGDGAPDRAFAPAPQRPWEREVTGEDRRQAEALFQEAVTAHEQLLRDQAQAGYEAALARWDNPHIHWNLALLMVDMGQPLRAYEHIDAVLAWGPDAFAEDDWAEFAGLRRRLLAEDLGVIEARSDQDGAEIALDGKPWFHGPASARQVVLPGEHVITARRPGHFPLARTVVVPAGAQGTVAITLSVDGINRERRWQPWLPWAVSASGALVAVVGVGLDRNVQRVDAFERELADKCGGKTMCDPATPSSYDRAVMKYRFALGSMIVGSTAVAAGLALVLLNQPRAYRTEDRGAGRFELAPIVSADAAGASARLRF